MNAVIDAIVAELETKRSELDRAISALRGLNGNGSAPAVRALPSPAKRLPKATTPKQPPEKLDAVKADWLAGSLSVDQIGEKNGKTGAWVYYVAKREGWGKRGSAPSAPAKSPKAGVGPERRCENCGQRTRANPCDHCFEKA